ncbi:MAG: TrkH family potassium uptake protein [Clostridium sp.]|nr:TrkH family potassium uptake protein [Clostridium sp.]
MDRIKKKSLSQAQIMALGFFGIILIGAFILMLPISSKNNEVTDFLSALFTSTSATCVTGLVVFDTFTHWSVFGQIVILCLIQIGGLGFFTIGVRLTMFLRRKVSLSQRGMLQESINTLKLSGILKLVKKIVWGTFLIEGSGAILLSIRYIPEFGVTRGIYYSIFHSVSAFCNGGFDLMGINGEYISLTRYSGDILVNITISLLIIIGGLGFVVWDDLTVNKFKFKKYMLHTKIVIVMTLVLIVGGSIMFYLFERNNLMQDMSLKDTILTSTFSSVTARTAGFNTIDTGSLTVASKLFNSILMFIGGSPGSTAGGVKTVTIVVILVCVWSNIRGKRGANIFNRRLDDGSIKKAFNVFSISFSLVIIATITICALQPELRVEDIIFEVSSAVGTVGMSTGITRELCMVSKIIIIILMYCGRLGSLTFAISFTEKKGVPLIQNPTEKVIIG